MPTYSNAQVIKPKSWEEFEEIVCSAAKIRFNNPDFSLHGRQGQAQDGVDVYGDDHKGHLIGLQCKKTSVGVSKATILDEISKAEAFEPPISKLYIATTAEADVKVQTGVRSLSAERVSKGQFAVQILFWGDIWSDLTKDKASLYQHYPELKPIAPGSSHDRRVFENFMTLLAFEPSIEMLKSHDFRWPFYRSVLKPLVDFAESWDSPTNDLIDSVLRDRLNALHAAARKLVNEIAERTGPVGDRGGSCVFSDSLRAAGSRPKHVDEDARILNRKADEFVLLYCEFVRMCQSKFDS